jgi:hypothetical protein
MTRSLPSQARTLLAATSIRRGLAAAHGQELVFTKSESEPSGLIETVYEFFRGENRRSEQLPTSTAVPTP